MKKMKKIRETVEEFLARGGVIQVIPKQIPIEAPIAIRATSMPENRIMSLDEGAHYFAENRKVNKPAAKKIALKDVVDSYGLPKEIADRLRGTNA